MDDNYEGMTAILYARVSTDDKDQNPQTQINKMRQWCGQRGVEILKEYCEEKSAKDMDRPQLQAAIGRIIAGAISLPSKAGAEGVLSAVKPVGILLAWQESRISRNATEMAQIVQTLKAYNCIIRYVSSSSEPESDTGELMNNINAWQASQERKKLALNTKVGMETAKANGVHCGRFLAFCFSHRVEENSKLVQNDPQAKRKTVIASKDMVLDYARQGFSIPQAARSLSISRETLRIALIDEGLIEEYRSSYESYRRQRGMPTRGSKPKDSVQSKGE